MVIPTFVYVWGLSLLTLRGLRKWVEMIIIANNDTDSEPMPESVKHLYN